MRRAYAPVAILILLASISPAQEKQREEGEKQIDLKSVPKAVIIEFKRTYPNGVIKGCSKERERGWTRYELETVDGKTKRDILYDPDGTAIVIEEALPLSGLPQPVRDALKKEYPKGKVSKAEKIIKDDQTQYEVVVKSGKESRELVYEADGTLAKTEKK